MKPTALRFGATGVLAFVLAEVFFEATQFGGAAEWLTCESG